MAKIPRTRRAQGDPRENTFDIPDAVQQLRELSGASSEHDGLDRLVPRAQRLLVAERALNPAPEKPAAHRALAAIHDAGERVLAAAAKAFFEFQVSPCRGIHDHGIRSAFRNNR